MKVLVSFQPNKKASDFEGVRLRKTIKGALEMVGVDYTTSIVERHDIVHLISPEDENKLNDAKENDIPVVVSALYCENDPLASYLEHKTKDNERVTDLTAKAQRFLNKADLVLVPSEIAREFLVDKGVTADISVALPGINMSRWGDIFSPADLPADGAAGSGAVPALRQDCDERCARSGR